MPNKIQIRRGAKSAMPQGSAGEPLWASDTKELYMGTGSGNVNMSGSHWYRGTAMSGISTTANQYSYSACPEVKLDDIYMNTSNGNIYACTTAGKGTNAKWTYQGCIKGATGATGSDATVEVDSSLSRTSTNPVQNKVINAYIEVFAECLKDTGAKILLSTDTVNNVDFCNASQDHTMSEVTYYCFGTKGLPSGTYFGKFIYGDDWNTPPNGVGFTAYAQSYIDLVTGNLYMRDLSLCVQDDYLGLETVQNWNDWVEC